MTFNTAKQFTAWTQSTDMSKELNLIHNYLVLSCGVAEKLSANKLHKLYTAKNWNRLNELYNEATQTFVNA